MDDPKIIKQDIIHVLSLVKYFCQRSRCEDCRFAEESGECGLRIHVANPGGKYAYPTLWDEDKLAEVLNDDSRTIQRIISTASLPELAYIEEWVENRRKEVWKDYRSDILNAIDTLKDFCKYNDCKSCPLHDSDGVFCKITSVDRDEVEMRFGEEDYYEKP